MKTFALSAAILAAGVLIGCGVPSTSETNGDRMTVYYKVDLPDGRQIDCLGTGAYRGGLSCDWTNAR